jgi:ABC-2 type transport system permease protein
MYSIFSKELKSFFSSIVGYIVLVVFVVVAGLFLWVFNDTSILQYGYASMELLILLIPAITMRLLADEYKGGTIEWLYTKPITAYQIIIGKYLAAFVLVLVALLPTILYVYSIHYLALKDNVIDYGAIVGSYLGLMCLASAFTAVGVFSSALTDNQIVGFLAALFLCFILYYGFEALSNIPSFRGGADYYLSLLGLDYHYKSINRGVVDTRDVVYFGTITVLFIVLTHFVLQRKKG